MTTLPNGPVVLEACVASVADSVAAAQSGAQRLELNVGIELGGLTPSVGLLELVKDAVEVPVLVMLRPRAGGFCYSASEKRLLIRDAELLIEHGADGLVTGGLSTEGLIDREFIETVRDVCSEGELVFHRAFDLIQEPSQAIEELVELRVDRILTSGGETTALKGATRISELLCVADGRIVVLPGGGIRSTTVDGLLEKTGCTQVHGTFKTLRIDPAGHVCGGDFPVVDAEEIRNVREILDRFHSGSL